MSNAKPSQIPEMAPIFFLIRARQFYTAAERAFDPKLLWDTPVYFLFFHAIELSFKAFLRSHNITTKELWKKKGHKVSELYEECRRAWISNWPCRSSWNWKHREHAERSE